MPLPWMLGAVAPFTLSALHVTGFSSLVFGLGHCV